MPTDRLLYAILCFAGMLLPTLALGQLKPLGQPGVTRAVVIGVSEFQNERIPRLKYAHADANAFAAYLRSSAGGGLPSSHIKLLTNQQATHAQMAVELTWLMEESQEGDVAIVYFSGHGDMETHTMMNHGFLLAYDAPASTYMMGGAFPVFYLQSVLQTLSIQKKAQAILITDACHAGKLAGSINQGTQATAQYLAQQSASEVRMLSCQPNEFSAEDAKWGGGHGVFTHFLIDGLMGMADANGDLEVRLLELQRFLQDQMQEAVPNQMPLIVGNMRLKVADVDEKALATLQVKRIKEKGLAPLPELAMKAGMKTASQDSVMALYRQFGKALAEKHLLYPEEGAAYTLYMLIKDKPAVAAYRQEMRLSLAAALQDDTQQAINDYLSADPAELRRRWAFDSRYEQYPAYLEKAASLLGEGHFNYEELRTKALYFTGLNLRLRGEKDRQATLYDDAIALQEQVLAREPTAAYAYNELGLLARRLGDYPRSIEQFVQALALSPTWVLALTNLCGSYVETDQYDLAAQSCQSALLHDSTFALAHHNLGTALAAQQRGEEALAAFSAALRHAPDYPLTHRMIGDVRYAMGDKAGAKAAWLETLRLSPRSTMVMFNLGIVCKEMGQDTVALGYFQSVIAEDGDDADAYLEIAELQTDLGRYAEADAALQSALQLAPQQPDNYYLLARLRMKEGQPGAALDALETAVQKGFSNYTLMKEDKAWDALRDQARFKALVADK